ncbi:uncharacterized protein F4817DRAFT_347358, partial [Daldinia loculata]|uniref:uncharacterized protein n=1 Tax=Daldinia loculata TaxID=103429 RepID=UPI0020C412B0
MRIWIPSRSLLFAGLRGHRPRRYSAVTNNVERVNIRVGSSGDMTIDLHNIAKLSSQSPLLVYLPPFSTPYTKTPVWLPRFMLGKPTAVINYRWDGSYPFQTKKAAALASTKKSDEEGFSPVLSWPAPIHDTSMAYNWIVRNLGPSGFNRRNIYLYGSYLGASLAMSLALTEAHPYQRTAVRGCIALNGIYNWTRFLPDHPINKPPEPGSTSEKGSSRPNDPLFLKLKQHVEALFVSPSGLFDPFASASLFFYTPELLVPPDFTTSALSPDASLLANVSLPNAVTGEPTLILRHPEKIWNVFPPMASALEIPQTLLLYTTPHSSLRGQQEQKNKENSFQTQARELGGVMRCRLYKGQQKERNKFDDDQWEDEPDGAVQVHNVGPSYASYAFNRKGEELAATWLEDHL